MRSGVGKSHTLLLHIRHVRWRSIGLYRLAFLLIDLCFSSMFWGPADFDCTAIEVEMLIDDPVTGLSFDPRSCHVSGAANRVSLDWHFSQTISI